MLKILNPGLLSTVQDLGRTGYQKYGVIASGVMDPLSHRIANLLVGNDENSPTVEMTLIGPSIEFQKDALIAICGADLSASINGKPIRIYRPIYVKEGSVLSFGPSLLGCRVYLAVAGSYILPKVMNSYSTYIRAGIGGFQGRPLQKKDSLHFGVPSELGRRMFKQLKKDAGKKSFVESDWSVTSDLMSLADSASTIRVMEGRQKHLFDKQSLEWFRTERFKVSNQSDRMGYRLEGPGLKLQQSKEMISEAVSFGTIQVPPNGQPIILLADRQTTGGYPKIGQVISVDLPIAAQLKPGDTIRFKEVSLDESQKLLIDREKKVNQLKNGINLKFQ